MLEINNLSIKINSRYIIKNLNLTIKNKDKLAIIGEEGNGKSTLLKAITGNLAYGEIRGQIKLKNNKIGFLSQTLDEKDPNLIIKDLLFENSDEYYDKISDLYRLFEELDLQEEILSQKIKYLSGGEKVKIFILKILLENPDILIFDEPTNDLDISTLTWLEKFINDCTKPIIYVSHDEALLSNTANMILHLEQIKDKTECKHTFIKMKYEDYIETRERSIEKQEQIAKNEQKEFKKSKERLNRIMQDVEYKQKNISRADPHGGRLLKKKMANLKSQEKRLNRTELTEKPEYEKSINFIFEEVNIPRGKTILNLELKELKIQNKILSSNIFLHVKGSEHIAIIGKNGTGKSTLIKYIYTTIKDRTDLKVGYMPQNYGDILNDNMRVLQLFAPTNNKDDITRSRTFLGTMNFTKEEAEGKIGSLSNGTKAKLILMKLVFDKCDVLILDEPTRNVSPLSSPVIRRVLKKFKGTIISVSHDRLYMKEVTEKIYLLTEKGLKDISNDILHDL